MSLVETWVTIGAVVWALIWFGKRGEFRRVMLERHLFHGSKFWGLFVAILYVMGRVIVFWPYYAAMYLNAWYDAAIRRLRANRR